MAAAPRAGARSVRLAIQPLESRLALTVPAAPLVSLAADTGWSGSDSVTRDATLSIVSAIPTLYATGVDEAGVPRENGAAELHYALVARPAGANATIRVARASNGYPIAPWIGDNGTSAWIGPTGPQLDGPAGTWTYATTFDLTGSDPATASITGRWAIDNDGLDIRLNGTSLGVSASGFTGFTAFSIDGGFVDGVNTLEFVTYNGGGPAGLRVEMSGSVGGASPGAALEYSTDGGLTWLATFEPIEGANVVDVRQVDAAGTPSAATSLAFVLDTTAAFATLDTTQVANARPTLTGTVDDPTAEIWVTVGGIMVPAVNLGDGRWVLDRAAVPVPLAGGPHDVWVTTADHAGNVGTQWWPGGLFVDLSTVFWDGDAGDGLWSSPANWSSDAVPTAGDTVVIGADAAGAPIAVDAAVFGVAITSSRTIELHGGSLENSRLAFEGDAVLRSTRQAAWEAGWLGNVTLAGTLDLASSSGAINVSGTLTLDGGTILLGDRHGTTAGRLFMRGTSSLAGTGEVILGTSWQNAVTAYGSVAADSGQPITDVLEIGAGVTIHGNGGAVTEDFDFPVARIDNRGAILGDAAPGPGGLPYGDFATAGLVGFNDNFARTVDRGAVASPLPEGSYRSIRWDNPSFSLPGLVAGETYTVRLHFAELWSEYRRQDVFIGDAKVLEDFSITDAAGGTWTAVTREFDVVADGSGTIAVRIQGTVDNGIVNAIEVFSGRTRLLLADCGSVPGTVVVSASVEFRNAGTLGASAGGGLSIPAKLVNTGTIAVDAGSTVSLGGVWSSSGTILAKGTVVVAGDMNLSEGGVILEGGVLDPSGILTLSSAGFVAGSGTIAADVVNGGRILPGSAVAAGTIDVGGALVQTAAGRVDLDLFADGTHDRIVVAGAASLAGTLAVHTRDNFAPANVGLRIGALAFAAASGTFDTLLGAAAGSSPLFALEATGQGVDLVAARTTPLLPNVTVRVVPSGDSAALAGTVGGLGFGPYEAVVVVDDVDAGKPTVDAQGNFRHDFRSLPAGVVKVRFRDADGNEITVVVGRLSVQPLDASLAPLPPLLAAVLQANAAVAFAADSAPALLPLSLGADRSVTVAVTPSTGGPRLRVELLAADGETVVASSAAGAPGEPVTLRAVPATAGGRHAIRVTALEGTGTVAVRAILDAALAAPAATTNLLVNGSFEAGAYGGGGYTRLAPGSTAIDGWVVGGSGLDWHAITGDAAHFGRTAVGTGLYAVDLSLDGGAASGSIAQTFATVPGTHYQVSFRLGAPWFNTEVRVSAGSTVRSFSLAAQSQYGFSWAQRTFSFVADAGTSTLLFESVRGGFWSPVIDDVAVVALPSSPLDDAALPLAADAERLAVVGRGADGATNVVAGKPVTASGTFGGGTPASVVDGVTFGRGTQWQSGTVWWNGTTPRLEIDLGGSFVIDRASLMADNNDTYVVQVRDPETGTWSDWWQVPNYSDRGIPGLVRRPDTGFSEAAATVSLPQVLADRVRVLATGGDNSYSVSELQVFGAPVTEGASVRTFAAEAGERVTVVLASTAGASLSAASLELVDPAGKVAAIAEVSPSIGGRVVGEVVVPTAGTWSVRVSRVIGEHVVEVVRGASLALDGNRSVVRPFGPDGVAVGDLAADAARLLSTQDLVQSWGVTLSADGRTAFVADAASGVFVFDVTDPTAPRRLSVIDTPGTAYDVQLSADGRFAYVSDWTSGIQILDVSVPSAPRRVGGYDTPGGAVRSALSADGATLFVADGTAGLLAIDVRVPASPVLVGSVDTPGNAFGVTLSPDGRTAYVSDQSSGVHVVDVSVPSAPVIRGGFDTLGSAWQARPSADGKTLFVADSDRGLLVLDVSTPSAIRLVGSSDTPGLAYGLAVSPDGERVFVADGSSGLRVIDVSDPASPRLVTALDTSGGALHVALTASGDVAFVADHASGLQAIDVARRSRSLHSLTANAGDRIVIDVSTLPGAAAGFAPSVDVLDPSGAVVASGSADAPISFTAALSGTHVVRVRGDGTSGAFVLSAGGSSAQPATTPLRVASTDPPSGAVVRFFPNSFRVTFDRGVILTSVAAADLTVDGVAATAVRAIGGRTLEFTLAAAAGDGDHAVAIAGGAILALDGTPCEPFAATFRLDSTAPASPVVSLKADTGSSDGDRITAVGTLAVSGVEAGALVEYSTDGGTSWRDAFVASEGKNAVLVRQVDAAGNVSKSSALDFVLDTAAPAAPTISLASDTGSSAVDGVTAGGSLAIGGVESGAVVEYSTDGGATWSQKFSASEGKNSVRARQTDVAGNVSKVSAVFEFTHDTTAPAAPTIGLANDTGSSAGDGVTADGSLAVGGLESGAIVEYSTDGGATWSSKFSAAEGKNSVRIRQSDAAGNVSKSSALDFVLDTSAPAAPTISLASDTGSSAVDGVTADGSLAIGGVESGAVVEYSTDGGATWSQKFSASEGKNSVRARQTDVAGNVSTAASLEFFLDTTAPAVPGARLTKDSGSYSDDRRSNDGRLTFTGVETGGTAQFSTNAGKSWSSAAELPEGWFASVLVRQIDAAGNVSAAAKALDVTWIRKSAPKPALALVRDTGRSASDRITSDATVVTTNVEAWAVVQYSTDGGASWSSGFKTREGANSVLVRQTDEWGNVGVIDAPFTFTVDTSAAAPSAALAVDSGASDFDRVTNVGTVLATDAEPGATPQYSTDGGVTWSDSFTAVPGANAVAVRQIDVAGNISPASTPVSFTFDPTAPRVTGRSLGPEVVQYLDRVEVTFGEALGGLSAADVTLAGPSGPLEVGTPVRVAGTTWRIPFAPLADVGQYTLTILPTAADVAGNRLDQDGDGTGGEADDAYSTLLVVARPDAAPEVSIARDGLSVSGSFTDPGDGQTWTATFDPGDGAGARPLALAGDGSFSFTLAGGRFAEIVVVVTDSNANVGRATLARAVTILRGGNDVTITGGEFDDSIALAVTDSGLLRHDLPLGGDLESEIDMDSTLAGVQSVRLADLGSLTVIGGPGDDRLDASGLPRGATLVGSEGDDVLVGSAGDDTILGGPGADTIRAGAGDDAIDAGPGPDDVAGGTGTDRLTFTGSPAADTFAVTADRATLDGVTTAFSGIDSVLFVSRGGDDSVTIAPGLAFPVLVSGISPSVEMRRDGDRIVGRVVGSFTDPGDGQTWTATIDPGDGLGARVLPLDADMTFTYALPDRPVMDIVATVTDDEGNSGSATIAVEGINRFLPAGVGLWNDAANWSAGRVPVAGGDEVAWVPAGRTVRIEGDTTVGPLRSRGTVELVSGTATFVSDTVIAGSLLAAPGTAIASSGPGASLATTGSAVLDGVALRAAAGATLRLGGVEALDAGAGALAWTADGASSGIEFPDLVSLRGVRDPLDAAALAVTATDGGSVTLPLLDSIDDGAVALRASGAGSAITAAALTNWSSTGGGGEITASSGGSVSFGGAAPALENVRVNATSSGTIVAGSLGLRAGSVVTGGGSVPSLVNTGGIVRAGGAGIGSLSVLGDFTQSGAGVLEIDLATLADHDAVDVVGRASIAGTVRIVRLAEPSVRIGDSINAITIDSHDGTVPTLEGATFGGLAATPILTGTGLSFCFPIVVALSDDPTEVSTALESAVATAATLGGTVAIALDTSGLGGSGDTLALDGGLPAVTGEGTSVAFVAAAGAGLTITGTGGTAIDVGTGAAATLSGITLSGFGGAGQGALANSGTLSLVNCSIEGTDGAGATISNAGTIVAANSSFAVIDNSGGDGSTLKLSDCDVTTVTNTDPNATIEIAGGTIDDLTTTASSSPVAAARSFFSGISLFSTGDGITDAGGLTSSTKIILTKATIRGTLQTNVPAEITLGEGASVKDIVSEISSAGGFTGKSKIILSKATLSGSIKTNSPTDITLGEGSTVNTILNTIDAAGGFTGKSKIILSKATLSGGITTNAPVDLELGAGSSVAGIVNAIDAAGGFTGKSKIILSKATLSGSIATNAPAEITLEDGSDVKGGILNVIDAAGGFTGTSKIILSKATLSGGITTNAPAEISLDGDSTIDGILNAIDAAGGFTGKSKIILSKATLSGGITTNAPVDLELGAGSTVAGNVANLIDAAGGLTGRSKIILSKATLSGSILTNSPADIEIGEGSTLGSIVHGITSAVAAAGGFTGSSKIILSKATLSGGIATNVPTEITLGEDTSVAGDVTSDVDVAIAAAGGLTGKSKIILSKATLGGSLYAYAPTDVEADGGSTLAGIVNAIDAAGGFTGKTKIILSKATLSAGVTTNAPLELTLGDGSRVAGDVVNAIDAAGGFTGRTKIILTKATLGGDILTNAPADVEIGEESRAVDVVNAIDAAGGFTGKTKIILSKATLSGSILTNAPADVEVGEGSTLESIVSGVDSAVAAAGGFTGSTKIILSKATLSGGIATNVPAEITLGTDTAVAGDVVNDVDPAIAAAGGLTGSTKIILSKATLGGRVVTYAPADIEVGEGSAVSGIVSAIDAAGGFTGKSKIILSKATLSGTLANLSAADITLADDSTVGNVYHDMTGAGRLTGPTKIILTKATLTGVLETRSEAEIEIGGGSQVAAITNSVADAGGLTGRTKIILTKASVTGTLGTRSPADITLGEDSTVANLYSDLSAAGRLTASTKIILSKATLTGVIQNHDSAEIEIGDGSRVAGVRNLLGEAGGLTGRSKIILSKATLTGTLYNTAPAEISIGPGCTVGSVWNDVEDGVVPAAATTITLDAATISGNLQNDAPATVSVGPGSVVGNLVNGGSPVAGWSASTIAVTDAKILRTFSNTVAATILLDGATFAGLVTSGAGPQMSVDVANSTFAYILNSGDGVSRIGIAGSSFQAVQNDGDAVVSIDVAGDSGSNTLVNNGDDVTIVFAAGDGEDVFVNNGAGDGLHGRSTTATVDLGPGRDRAVLGGSFVASTTIAGGAGDDDVLFAGDVTGVLALVEADGVDTDTLDFSPLSAGAGVTIDLAVTAPQTVRGGLVLALSGAAGFENVVGTAAADTIRGNSRPNRLSGADIADDRQGAGAAWNGRTQVVVLDFDTETNTDDDVALERVYTPSDREAVRAAVQAAYSGYPVSVVLSRPSAGEYATVYFNLTRDDGEPGGDSSEIDFGNRSLGGTATVQVNGLLGLPGYPDDTTGNWVNASAWIAAHEIGHLMGLRHADSFGPVGFGIHAPPGGQGFRVCDVFATNFIHPEYEGPSAAWETNDHVLATAALTGFTTWDAVGATFFGEREGVKLAYARTAPTTPDGRLLVDERATEHGTLSPAGSQALVPVAIDVPNSLLTGLFTGKDLLVSAVAVIGRIAAAGEKDVYRIEGRVGDVWNVQLMSTALARLGDDVFDGIMKIYDSSGQLLTTSDDEFESQDPSVIDFRLPADGSYYVEVAAFDDPDVADDGTGGRYELFAWRFDTAARTDAADTLEGRGGDDTLEGGFGDDVYVFAGTALGADTIREDARLVASGVGNAATVDGRDSGDTLDFRSAGFAIDVDLASAASRTVATGDLVLRLSSARDASREPALSAAIEKVLGSTTFSNTVSLNARANTVVGGSAADTVRFAAFAKPAGTLDTVTAGAGTDTLDFSAYPAGIILNLATTAAAQTIAGRHSLRLTAADTENVIGTPFRDILTGNSLDNVLEGRAGNDQLVGGVGADILLGGLGNDNLSGGAGSDFLVGGAGSDVLNAGGGNDIMVGGEFRGTHAADGRAWTVIALLRMVLSDWSVSRVANADLSTAADDVIDAATAAERDTFTVGVGTVWLVIGANDTITDSANFSTAAGDRRTNV